MLTQTSLIHVDQSLFLMVVELFAFVLTSFLLEAATLNMTLLLMSESNTLESSWCLLPTLLCSWLLSAISMSTLSLLELDLTTATSYLVSSQWMWSVGINETNTTLLHVLFSSDHEGTLRLLEDGTAWFHIPSSVVFMLTSTSRDVIHSFASSTLQLKLDSVPGRSNSVYICSKFVGTLQANCTELCGSYHGVMSMTLVST